jgi:carbon starvation protein
VGYGSMLMEAALATVVIIAVCAGIDLAYKTAAFLAFATGADGNGALKLWPMFGAVNQLLAALVLIVITIYVKRRGGLWFLLTGVPALFMLVVTVWGVVENEVGFVSGSNWPLVFVNGVVLVLSGWVIVEGAMVVARGSKHEP